MTFEQVIAPAITLLESGWTLTTLHMAFRYDGILDAAHNQTAVNAAAVRSRVAWSNDAEFLTTTLCHSGEWKWTSTDTESHWFIDGAIFRPLMFGQREGGRKYIKGDVMKNPELLQLYKDLRDAADPLAYFYDSAFTDGLIAKLGAAHETNMKGASECKIHARSDFAGYKAVYRAPLESYYNGHRVIGMPSPTYGGTATLAAMATMEAVDPTYESYDSTDRIVRMFNNQNKIWAARYTCTGDADHDDVAPLADFTTWRTKAVANTQVLPPPVAAPNVTHFGSNTVALAVTDKFGNVVSTTISQEMDYGSGIMFRGMVLNNQLTDFSGDGECNRASGERLPRKTALGEDASTVGGKRPRSSISPIVVGNMAIGSAGGTSIPFANAFLAMRAVDRTGPLSDDLMVPRYYTKNDAEGLIAWTRDTPGLPKAELEERGMKFKVFKPMSAMLESFPSLEVFDITFAVLAGRKTDESAVALRDLEIYL